MQIILTHNNADFDAVASMLAAHKLYPDALPVLPPRLNRNVADFIELYRNGLPFIAWSELRLDDSISRLILTDTQSRPDIKKLPPQLPTLIIEHHPQERKLAAHETWMGEPLGAVTTLLVEQIRERQIHLSSLEATLLALGIYADTGNLTYGGTTSRDLEAAAWLLRHGAVLDTVRRFLSVPLDDDQHALFAQLLRSPEDRTVQGYTLTLCQTSIDRMISGINGVTEQLRDVLDPSAIFVLVKMPQSIQLVCRSTDDAVPVDEVARRFGGGGHPRAAAATIYSSTLEAARETLWNTVAEIVRPAVRVAHLMSYGIQTVDANATISKLITRIRRIGHEGYPVLDNGEVVGLLTLRDADRALEHGLTSATVRDVMRSGRITLSPEDSVTLLEQTMVNSGWGQIPVVHEGQLLGIVTRTDLIKHWARIHPSATPPQPRLELGEVAGVLGSATARLIEHISAEAQAQQITLYMVGGVVRDLLLKRQNYDLDFVVEGDAIAFAQHLQKLAGGEVHSYAPFSTAKWYFPPDFVRADGLNGSPIPEHIDFATARNEFYMHPTALPTVYSGSIKLDLGRRDFTINTLAVQLSPARNSGNILDFFGGLDDLKRRRIQVLHSLSFVDDPTRILRAVRFAQRLSFEIEPRTRDLMERALSMLRRITGERIRNEINLILAEERPEYALLDLQRMGALEGIHPAFQVSSQIVTHFSLARSRASVADIPVEQRFWHLIMASIPVAQIPDLCNRLLFGQPSQRAFVDTARLLQEPALLADSSARPSQLVRVLDSISEESLRMALLLAQGLLHERLIRYLEEWRSLRPTTTGHTLKARGLPTGPSYRRILERLRAAWLDGEIHDAAGEAALLETLLEAPSHD